MSNLIHTLYSSFGFNDSDFPRDLIGATIVDIGTPKTTEEGVLIIDYISIDKTKKRIELRFTETSMWVESESIY